MLCGAEEVFPIPKSTIELLERNFTRVPLEEAKRIARQTQRVLEKEWRGLKETQKVPLILQKIEMLRDQEVASLELAKRRQEYLDRILQEDNAHGPEEYMRVKYYRLLVDYLARKGEFDLAHELAKAFNIQDLCDIKVFEEYHTILQTMRDGKRTTEALQWCSENRSHLKKTSSPLEFILRRQDLLDLVAKGKKGQAVIYAKKHLTLLAATDPALLPLIQQALAMLITPRRTQHHVYQELAVESDRWQEIMRVFREAYFGLYAIPQQTPLFVLVQMGCAAFKTAACGGDTRVVDCPACNEELHALVRPLPFAHFEYSRLYCRLSKTLMSDDNPPYALPNGQIYSLEALREMAAKNDGWITCPVTEASYRMDQTKKCYML